jgi:hypothetical protein
MGNKITKPRSKKQVPIDTSKYVNLDTGEILESEVSKHKVSITVTEEGDFVVITSDDFVILDSKTVKFLNTLLSKTELSNLLLMAQDLKTSLNIIYNGPIPHTHDSLQEFLGYSSKAMFLKLLKTLMHHGVIYQIKGRIMGEIRVIYMLNPFVARKRKTIDKQVFSIFKPFIP